MTNSNIPPYSLPPGYSIRQETRQDIQETYKPIINQMIIVILITGSIILVSSWFSTQDKDPLIFAQIVLRTILILTGIGLGGWLLFSDLLPRDPSTQAWVVTYRDRVVGSATIWLRNDYSFLASIKIEHSHWFKGIGTYLLWESIRDVRKPIYLCCSPRLKPFYRRFGFISVSKQDCPQELRPHYSPNESKIMGLFDMAILPMPSNSPNNSLPADYSIRGIENISEQVHIYQRFWSREYFQRSRIYVFCLNGIVGIMAIAISSIICNLMILPYGNFILLWSAVTIVFSSWVSFFAQLLFFWREWVIWYEDNPIGHFHVFQRSRYSIIYSLHIEPQHQAEEIIPFILERFQSRFPQPMYLLSLRNQSSFYRQFGFQVANHQRIPLELQVFLPQDFIIMQLNSRENND